MTSEIRQAATFALAGYAGMRLPAPADVVAADHRHAVRYEPCSGLSPDVFLGNWLLITGLLCAGSALLLVVRTVRSRRREGRGGRPTAVRGGRPRG
ncbi:hypothetical protein ACIQZB_15275 [Streptomyces sp. NPDC097727]|uniref:hypothetical protein n=1 Tax=Streptomyces sp. NPDC097727 TaxID=3366092 RepID=UPI003808E65A